MKKSYVTMEFYNDLISGEFINNVPAERVLYHLMQKGFMDIDGIWDVTNDMLEAQMVEPCSKKEETLRSLIFYDLVSIQEDISMALESEGMDPLEATIEAFRSGAILFRMDRDL